MRTIDDKRKSDIIREIEKEYGKDICEVMRFMIVDLELTKEEIAKHLSVTSRTITSYAAKCGIAAGRLLTEEEVKKHG